MQATHAKVVKQPLTNARENLMQIVPILVEVCAVAFVEFVPESAGMQVAVVPLLGCRSDSVADVALVRHVSCGTTAN